MDGVWAVKALTLVLGVVAGRKAAASSLELEGIERIPPTNYGT